MKGRTSPDEEKHRIPAARTFSRPGLKNRVDLRTQPRARYSETRVYACDSSGISLARMRIHLTASVRASRERAVVFCAVYRAPSPLPACLISHNSALIARISSFVLSKGSESRSRSENATAVGHERREKFSHNASSFFRPSGESALRRDSHFSSSDETAVGHRCQCRTLHSRNGKKKKKRKDESAVESA